MIQLPEKFYPPFLPEPSTRIPHALRNWLGRRLLGPPRGPRLRRKKACVHALGRIGDFVLSVSAFRLFAREFGPDQLTLVAPAALQPLAARELPGVEFLALPGEAPGLVRDVVPLWRRARPRFAGTHFERRITLNHFRSFYQEIARSWTDADADFCLTPETFPTALQDGQCRELQAHRLVASAALGREVGWDEIVPRFTSFSPADDGRLLVYPLSHDGLKSISQTQTVILLRYWRRKRPHAAIVLGGSPRDLTRLESYAAACRAAGLENVVVEAPAGITAFIDHVAAAGAVLATDSAAAHVAIACDKPTVVVMPRVWHTHSLPWHRSDRQRTFVFEDSIETIAAAMC